MSVSSLVSLSLVVVSVLPGLGIVARDGLRKQWPASIKCNCVDSLSVSMQLTREPRYRLSRLERLLPRGVR